MEKRWRNPHLFGKDYIYPPDPSVRRRQVWWRFYHLESLLCDEEILARSRYCSPRRLDTFFSPEFKVSGAGSREEDFQRLSWWGKVQAINHWRCLRVPRHLWAAPQTALQTQPSRRTNRENGEATSLSSLKNAQWSREAGLGYSSVCSYLPFSPHLALMWTLKLEGEGGDQTHLARI